MGTSPLDPINSVESSVGTTGTSIITAINRARLMELRHRRDKRWVSTPGLNVVSDTYAKLEGHVEALLSRFMDSYASEPSRETIRSYADAIIASYLGVTCIDILISNHTTDYMRIAVMEALIPGSASEQNSLNCHTFF